MPCPHFEPLTTAEQPDFPGARLPLFDEYDGRCWATGCPEPIEKAVRMLGCNHGNLQQVCRRQLSKHAVIRFTANSVGTDYVQVTSITERNFEPVRWEIYSFDPASGKLEPEIADVCHRAQLLAFCRSYLKRTETPK